MSVLAAIGDSYVSSATSPNQMYTSTVTIGSSYSTSVVNPQQVVSGTYTVIASTGTNLLCEFKTFNFTASTGQFVSGGFSSDYAVSFYVVPQTAYQNWLKAGTCGNAGDAIASSQLTTGFSFNATAIPSSGTWTIVLVNSSNSHNADVTVAAYLSAGGYTVTQPIMGTITSTFTSFINGQSTSVPGFPLASIALGAIVGLIVLGVLRRRKQRSELLL